MGLKPNVVPITEAQIICQLFLFSLCRPWDGRYSSVLLQFYLSFLYSVLLSIDIFVFSSPCLGFGLGPSSIPLSPCFNRRGAHWTRLPRRVPATRVMLIYVLYKLVSVRYVRFRCPVFGAAKNEIPQTIYGLKAKNKTQTTTCCI